MARSLLGRSGAKKKERKERGGGCFLASGFATTRRAALSFPRGLSLLIGELSRPRWLGDPAPFLRGRLASFWGVGGGETAGGSGSPKGSGSQIFGASLADLYSPSPVGKLKSGLNLKQCNNFVRDRGRGFSPPPFFFILWRSLFKPSAILIGRSCWDSLEVRKPEWILSIGFCFFSPSC